MFLEKIISIKNVSKVYKVGNERVVALNNVSLDIEKGEICCFLGTSGSGKSTLLNLLAGLEKPTKGDIYIKGIDISRLNERRVTKFRQKYIGFVFQSYNLIPTYTALENVYLPLVFKGIRKKSREKAAKKILKDVGLLSHIKHKPSQMSGGQQQRVGIARAFVSKPDIVFADEPTGNLDTKTTSEVMEIIIQMARQRNQTLIIVTHDREISGYADRVFYIRDGRIDRIEENAKSV